MLEPHVYEWVREAGGSVSAEHGLGQMKVRRKELWKGLRAREHLGVCMCMCVRARARVSECVCVS